MKSKLLEFWLCIARVALVVCGAFAVVAFAADETNANTVVCCFYLYSTPILQMQEGIE